jgi:hypothetical protein
MAVVGEYQKYLEWRRRSAGFPDSVRVDARARERP